MNICQLGNSFLTPERTLASTLMLMKRKIPENASVSVLYVSQSNSSTVSMKELNECLQLSLLEFIHYIFMLPLTTESSLTFTYMFPAAAAFCITRGHFMWKHNFFFSFFFFKKDVSKCEQMWAFLCLFVKRRTSDHKHLGTVLVKDCSVVSAQRLVQPDLFH